MPGNFQIAYALTSDGTDVFADMALVSALSARLSNPGIRLRILADEESAAALQAAQHPVLEFCDELLAAPAPGGSPVLRNRWVKTQAAEWVEGDCLLLDCDTIVAGDLSAAWSHITDVGLVANHHAPDLGGQISREDLDSLRRMGWPTDFSFYANGGALFFRPTPAARQFFRRWHHLWQQGVTDLNRLRDQPALNAVLREGVAQVAELPQAFNCQVSSVFSRPGESPAIWHFYGSQGGTSSGCYAHLLSLARQGNTAALRKSVRRAIHRRILDPSKPARHGVRFKAAIEASLEPARDRNIALLLSSEYEGIYRNGGIGTYYREISRLFRQRGWFTILLNLSPRPIGGLPPLSHLDRVFHGQDLAELLELSKANALLLSGSETSFLNLFGTRSLLFIQAVANTFPGQKIYAEFHEMCGPGYHAAKARESGWLDPNVVVAVTMHSGHEWIYEANDAILSQDNQSFLNASSREEDSFRSADLAMFPSDSLHHIVDTYGWRTRHAARLPYSIPLPERDP